MKKEDGFSRQSFLGEKSQEIIENTAIGIVGLGGGGSHIAQQLAHIGFLKFVLADPDTIENTNLNRMVGARSNDVSKKRKKVLIMERTIKGVRPKAVIQTISSRWQDGAEAFKQCDIIFGCVDSFKERNELEIFCRRFLIPYIDIGMDVFSKKGEDPRMVGQVILSLPGNICMRCMDFITDKKLSYEASRYGKAGHRPQVVWPNGILASSAVGIAINLLTGWTHSFGTPLYLSYDGNRGILETHVRLRYMLNKQCVHFPHHQVGRPALVSA